MKARTKFLVSVLMLASCSIVFAQQEQKMDEVSALISAARFLEQNPLDKKAKGIRRSAMEWVIATDKVSVMICSKFLIDIDKKYKYSSELLGQYTIGMAAFKLSKPGKDEASAQLAGYESSLLSRKGQRALMSTAQEFASASSVAVVCTRCLN